jgi:hypothetical protein
VLYVGIAVVAIVIAALTIAALPGSLSRTHVEVAELIDSFVEGRGAPYEWDAFTSIRIKERDLDEVRARCCAIQDEYPPTRVGELCSPDGIAALRKLAREVRAAA